MNSPQENILVIKRNLVRRGFVMLREAKHSTISREITRIMMSVILAK
jgi:hypothetical protein